MPELPEVETVRRGLAPVMEGAAFQKVEQRRGDLRVPFPRGFARKLTGRKVESVGRRAKYLTLDLDDGDTLAVMAIQKADGERGRAEASRLAGLVAAHAAPEPPAG